MAHYSVPSSQLPRRSSRLAAIEKPKAEFVDFEKGETATALHKAKGAGVKKKAKTPEKKGVARKVKTPEKRGKAKKSTAKGAGGAAKKSAVEDGAGKESAVKEDAARKEPTTKGQLKRGASRSPARKFAGTRSATHSPVGRSLTKSPARSPGKEGAVKKRARSASPAKKILKQGK